MIIPAIIGLVGSLAAAGIGAASASADRGAQMKLARNRISMTARDARSAGIHPLAALGASYPNYTPVGDGGAGGIVANAAANLADSLGVKQAERLARADRAEQLKLERMKTASAVRLDEAQALEANARTITMLQEAQRAAIGGAISATNLGQPEIAALGSKENPWPATGYWRGSDGSIYVGPNPEYAIGIDEIAYPGMLRAGQYAYTHEREAAKPTGKKRTILRDRSGRRYYWKAAGRGKVKVYLDKE